MDERWLRERAECSGRDRSWFGQTPTHTGWRMIEHRVDDDTDAHLQKVTEMLKEIMNKSPDPHLPEERERAISDLIERAFPNLGIVLLKGEE